MTKKIVNYQKKVFKKNLKKNKFYRIFVLKKYIYFLLENFQKLYIEAGKAAGYFFKDNYKKMLKNCNFEKCLRKSFLMDMTL